MVSLFSCFYNEAAHSSIRNCSRNDDWNLESKFSPKLQERAKIERKVIKTSTENNTNMSLKHKSYCKNFFFAIAMVISKATSTDDYVKLSAEKCLKKS